MAIIRPGSCNRLHLTVGRPYGDYGQAWGVVHLLRAGATEEAAKTLESLPHLGDFSARQGTGRTWMACRMAWHDAAMVRITRMSERLPDHPHPSSRRGAGALARILSLLQRHADVLTVRRWMVRHTDHVHEPEAFLNARRTLAAALAAAGQHGEARDIFEVLTGEVERSEGDRRRELLLVLDNYVGSLGNALEPHELLPHARRVVELDEALDGRSTYASLTNLGALLYRTKSWSEADEILARAEGAMERERPEPMKTVSTLRARAACRLRLGDATGAIERLSRCTRIVTAHLGVAHPRTCDLYADELRFLLASSAHAHRATGRARDVWRTVASSDVHAASEVVWALVCVIARSRVTPDLLALCESVRDDVARRPEETDEVRKRWDDTIQRLQAFLDEQPRSEA